MSFVSNIPDKTQNWEKLRLFPSTFSKCGGDWVSALKNEDNFFLSQLTMRVKQHFFT
jgi:hypothetical protein